MRQLTNAIVLILTIAFGSIASFGQAGSSTITGTVKDSTDAAIPGVRVRALNIETGIQVDTITNEDGVFRISALVPGNYSLQAELPGFSKMTRGPLARRRVLVTRPRELTNGTAAIPLRTATPCCGPENEDPQRHQSIKRSMASSRYSADS